MHPPLDVGGRICFGNWAGWSTGKTGWMDIRILLEPVTLPVLGRVERLRWETAKGHVFIAPED